jgi:hypothetical protein
MSEKVLGVLYPVKGDWYRRNLDPKYSYQWAGKGGFITNGRGNGFKLHASTHPKEIVSLCAYLDLLESKVKEEPL